MVISEEWRGIDGWPYEVSSLGRVRNAHGRILRPGVGSNGYALVVLSLAGKRRSVRVHSLVAEAFVPRPGGRVEVRHLDGERLNNVAANLAWGSRADNMADAIRHGTTNHGERSPSSKLNRRIVLAMRARRAEGLSFSKLAREFGVSIATAHKVVAGPCGYVEGAGHGRR